MRTPRTPLTGVEELLRRLIALGLPLTIGCGSSSLGTDGPIGPVCDAANVSYDQVLVVPRPTQDPDAGMGPTIEGWDLCAQDAQCETLCRETAPLNSGLVYTVCGVVTDAADAGDASADPDAGTQPSLDLHVAYSYSPCGPSPGRRPAGFAARRRCTKGSQIGRWFADVAVLEAASVPAFRRLAAELTAHGAPAPLVSAARRAAGDEVRHYRLTAAVARQGGAEARPPRVRRAPVRSLVAMAAENAREGCVRETFGAATAAFQARHAADPRLRAVMTAIARDEARHALLAWEIDAWARAALPPSGARRLSSARAAAARALESEIASAPPLHPSLARALGHPSPAALRRLVAETRDLLWDAVA
ncbi:MAG TPA: ferritin-like domain-containing protein [Polyangia bacterium]|jgi:hypothetical protein